MQIFHLLVLGIFAIFAFVTQTNGFQPKYSRLLNTFEEYYQKDMKIIPISESGEPVEVGISLFPINILEADTLTKVVKIEIVAWISWNTTKTWNPRFYNDASSMRLPRDMIWVPDITLYNGVGALENGAPDIVVISNDGQATWVPKWNLQALCDVDVYKLASNATCHLTFGSWTYDSDHVTVKEQLGLGVDLSYYFFGSSYNIVSTTWKRNVQSYSCCPKSYEVMKFNITFVEKLPNGSFA